MKTYLFPFSLSLLILMSCQNEVPIPKDKQLKVILESELPLKDALGIEIDLRNDIENWDYLAVIGSKSDMKGIEKKLSLDLSGIRKNPIWHTDSLNLIIFINNHKLSKIAEINRLTGDFKNYEELIPRANAVLRTTKTGQLIFDK